MHAKLISFALAAAMALTSVAPAQAQSRDNGQTAAIVAGLAGLAILGAVIAENNKDKKRDKRRARAARDDHAYGYRQVPRRDDRYRAPRHRADRDYYRSERRHKRADRYRHDDRRSGYRGQPYRSGRDRDRYAK